MVFSVLAPHMGPPALPLTGPEPFKPEGGLFGRKHKNPPPTPQQPKTKNPIKTMPYRGCYCAHQLKISKTKRC
ncbi:MAG: hypothetical protein LRS49_01275, partial [Desulfurococcales archaeon]|nr:hypothetical protein [Desulfurococcales archaeon]